MLSFLLLAMGGAISLSLMGAGDSNEETEMPVSEDDDTPHPTNTLDQETAENGPTSILDEIMDEDSSFPGLVSDVVDVETDEEMPSHEIEVEQIEPTSVSEIIEVNLDNGNPKGYVDLYGDSVAYFDGSFDLPQVNSSDAGSYIVVESGSVSILTGAGDDTVDAHGMESGIIKANDGDVIYGSDVQGAEIGVAVDSASFFGGQASEVGVATGEGSVLSGGGGNDFFAAFEGSAKLIGGEGDDTLLGNATADQWLESSRVDHIGFMSNVSQDVLSGGAGEDYIVMSNGDVATGGQGEDVFRVFHNENSELDAAVVTDFSPDEDLLFVEVGGGDPWDYHDASYDLTGRTATFVHNGGTYVTVDNEVVLAVEGLTEISVGIPDFDSVDRYGQSTAYRDIESGEIKSPEDFDVVVEVFHARSS